jgi:hypothetical protein
MPSARPRVVPRQSLAQRVGPRRKAAVVAAQEALLPVDPRQPVRPVAVLLPKSLRRAERVGPVGRRSRGLLPP